MGNKEKLQVNNTNLRNQILKTIQNLPGGAPYTGDNPLTVGSEGYTIPANTLIEQALKLVSNGVDLSNLFGCTKMAIDKFTVSKDTSTYGEIIFHSLGIKPKFALLLANKSPAIVGGLIMVFVGKEEWKTEHFDCRMIAKYNEGYGRYSWNCTSVVGVVSAESVQFGDSTATAKKFAAGIEYTLLTMA